MAFTFAWKSWTMRFVSKKLRFIDMACFEPLKAFRVVDLKPVKDDNGNDIIDPVSEELKLPLMARQWTVKVASNKVQAFDKNLKPIFDAGLVRADDFREFEYVPCRKCFGCREDAAKAWTDRLMIEYQYHEQSWFVTLTYDDDHLRLSEAVDADGVMYDDPTLCKKDLQDFFKRLRRYYDSKEFKKLHGEKHLMYFAAGEYGGQSKRPHYHAIIFDLFLDDLKEWKRYDGYVYYSSAILENIWQKGFVSVAKVTRETCAYTCRYVMKKAMGVDKQAYLDKGLEPEFQLMSRRPSIARRYFNEKVAEDPGAFYETKIHFLTGPDSAPISFNIPRYFDYLTEKQNEDIIVSVKEKRKKIGRAVQKLKEAQSDKPYLEILAAEQAVKIGASKLYKKGGKSL